MSVYWCVERALRSTNLLSIRIKQKQYIYQKQTTTHTHTHRDISISKLKMNVEAIAYKLFPCVNTIWTANFISPDYFSHSFVRSLAFCAWLVDLSFLIRLQFGQRFRYKCRFGPFTRTCGECVCVAAVRCGYSLMQYCQSSPFGFVAILLKPEFIFIQAKCINDF